MQPAFPGCFGKGNRFISLTLLSFRTGCAARRGLARSAACATGPGIGVRPCHGFTLARPDPAAAAWPCSVTWGGCCTLQQAWDSSLFFVGQGNCSDGTGGEKWAKLVADSRLASAGGRCCAFPSPTVTWFAPGWDGCWAGLAMCMYLGQLETGLYRVGWCSPNLPARSLWSLWCGADSPLGERLLGRITVWGQAAGCPRHRCSPGPGCWAPSHT